MLVLERSVGFELLMLELEALCAIPYTPLLFLFMCILELPHILSIYFYRKSLLPHRTAWVRIADG
jgi:hypothetical protein